MNQEPLIARLAHINRPFSSATVNGQRRRVVILEQAGLPAMSVVHAQRDARTEPPEHKCMLAPFLERSKDTKCVTFYSLGDDGEICPTYASRSNTCLVCDCNFNDSLRFYGFPGTLAALDFQGYCCYIDMPFQFLPARPIPTAYFKLMSSFLGFVVSQDQEHFDILMRGGQPATYKFQMLMNKQVPHAYNAIDAFVHFHVVALLSNACMRPFEGHLCERRNKERLALGESLPHSDEGIRKQVQYAMGCMPLKYPLPHEHYEDHVETLALRHLRTGYVFWRRIRFHFLLIQRIIHFWTRIGIRFQTLLDQHMDTADDYTGPITLENPYMFMPLK